MVAIDQGSQSILLAFGHRSKVLMQKHPKETKNRALALFRSSNGISMYFFSKKKRKKKKGKGTQTCNKKFDSKQVVRVHDRGI